MRSKLLSLHLILTIMMQHIDVFTSEDVFFSFTAPDAAGHRSNPFILEVKQYLCPSIGRNAFSVVPQVFDTTHEILWRVVQGLRVFLKSEIEIFLKEIVLRILEMRTASNQQKFSLLRGLLRVCEDSQTLVDIYLNYDCDEAALDNIYERLVNVLSKVTTSHNQPTTGKDYEHPDPITSKHGIPPPLTTQNILNSDKQQLVMPESAIRFKSLECLVAVLRSLVGWYTNNSVSISAGTKDEDTPRASEDQPPLTAHQNVSNTRLASPVTNGSSTNLSSSRLDDPEEFENLKHRKQVLQEGIRQFNWKPKKGLAVLAGNGFLDLQDPKSVAQFLLATEGLNKTLIGEYLGEG
jgi:brefeldin A-inhibited guanine nucleotide-exchange protein